MIVESLNLKDLLDIAQREGDTISPQIPQHAITAAIDESIGPIRAIWRESDRQVQAFPAAIAIEEGRRRSFLAWVITYLPQLRPFTAFCRVFTPDVLDDCIRRETKASLPDLGLFEEACLGLILGELGTLTKGTVDIRAISLVGCQATLSYALMRALALGISRIDVRQIRASWTHARMLTKQVISQVDTEQLESPWKVLLCLTGKEAGSRAELPNPYRDILRACDDVLRHGRILPQQWTELTKGWNSEGFEESLDKPREERVIRVRRLLESLSFQSKGDLTTRAFLAGYLVNQIGPGSFEHFALLFPVIERLPGVLLWYGLIAGLRRKSYLRNFSGSLGRRVLRDALRRESVSDQPTCDVSLAELEILSVSSDYKAEMRSGSQGHVTVEIAPCVNTIVRVGPQGTGDEHRGGSGQRPQGKLFEDQSVEASETQRALADLWDAFADIDKIRSRIGKYLEPPEPKRSKRRGKG